MQESDVHGHQCQKLNNMERCFWCPFLCVSVRNRKDYTKVSQCSYRRNSTNNLILNFCLPFSDIHYAHMFNYWSPIFNINIFLLIFLHFIFPLPNIQWHDRLVYTGNGNKGYVRIWIHALCSKWYQDRLCPLLVDYEKKKICTICKLVSEYP